VVSDVAPSADALLRRVRALATSLAEFDRVATPDAREQLEAQIARLEEQANPLDHVASEERIRRLALLKRQRSALADQARRREELSRKLESCALALHSMKLDLLRLHASEVSQSADHITLLTERARALADDVDAAVYAADEVGRVTSGTRRQGPGARR
jgi:serine/threonine-protein kinase